MNDLVDKATAWDACDASFKKGLAKGRAEAVSQIEAHSKLIEEMLPYVEYINKVQRGPFYLKINAERILSKSNPNTPERNDK